MRRRNLLIVLAGLTVAAAAVAFVLWPRGERITAENFRRIKEGMSRAEVEAILGPPDDHSTGPIWDGALYEYGPAFSLRTHWDAVWLNDAGSIQLNYNLDDPPTVWKLERRTFYQHQQLARTPIEKMVWRIKHQWWNWFPE